jgi:hypothetical protein
VAASRAWNLLLGHVRLLLFEALHRSLYQRGSKHAYKPFQRLAATR